MSVPKCVFEPIPRIFYLAARQSTWLLPQEGSASAAAWPALTLVAASRLGSQSLVCLLGAWSDLLPLATKCNLAKTGPFGAA